MRSSVFTSLLAGALGLSVAAASAQADHHKPGEETDRKPGAAAHKSPPSGTHTAKGTDADLPLERRQEIFRALLRAESRADRQAAEQSKAAPESMAQDKLAEKLTREYRAKVMHTYGITKRRAEEIVSEGYAKSWRTSAEGREKTELD